ncbi:MAG: hypothetical protein P4M12_00555 [Gammaproteobacteria bacterium]|nr:hypothetical protein [Gammaproteobacteria bacterium]
MPYITREDGVRFIIPSYRDTLIAKKTSLLKREIMLLSSSYGEYITLQKRNATQYEVAFSPDTGYLLGECVWQNFNRPADLIYCEAIPNTVEAILVIVKSGSVYLDGSFPLDAIPEELVVFLSQQNNFNIYVNGDVPISQTPEEGKFSFEANSVASFTVLDEPVFPKLPVVKSFQLQLVDTVLKAQGIGTLPIKQLAIIILVLGLLWVAWDYFTTPAEVTQQVQIPFVQAEDNMQMYRSTLASPAPYQQLQMITRKLSLVYDIPGWTPTSVDYVLNSDNAGSIHIAVASSGVKMQTLFLWAKKIDAKVEITGGGIFLNFQVLFYKREAPTGVMPLERVVGNLIDNLDTVMKGNNLQLGKVEDKRSYSEAQLTLTIHSLSPDVFDMVSQQLRGLPLTLSKASFQIEQGNISGTINLKALGN